MKTINLDEKLKHFDTHWDPHVVADYNHNDVMVVKFKGAFPFHKHETTDDFFYVLDGEMFMDIEGEPSRTVKAGEMFVVPKASSIDPVLKAKSKLCLSNRKANPIQATLV